MSNRVVGKYGARPAVFPAALHDLTYYSAGPLPAAPASVPVPGVASWDVLGNDKYGNCGVAGLEHLLEADAADTSAAEGFPSADQCIAFYLRYTGGQDTGVVLSQFLAYVRKHGYYGHKVTAYAPVSVHDVPVLKAAVYLYDGIYTGITVTQAMEEAFQEGRPWDSAAVQGEPVGGHCVPVVAYDDSGLTVITWGQPQLITWPAWHAISTEAWAVITGELAGGDGHGINLAALKADLGKLDAAPAPAPDHAGVLAELSALLRNAEADAEQILDDARNLLSRIGL